MSSSTTPTTSQIYGVNSESSEVAQINTNANHRNKRAKLETNTTFNVTPTNNNAPDNNGPSSSPQRDTAEQPPADIQPPPPRTLSVSKTHAITLHNTLHEFSDCPSSIATSATTVYLNIEQCKQCNFDEVCPYISSNRQLPCPLGDTRCNYNHTISTTGCLHKSETYTIDLPSAVSFRIVRSTNSPFIQLFGDAYNMFAGESDFMYGRQVITPDDDIERLGILAKQRLQWIEEHDILLPFLYKKIDGNIDNAEMEQIDIQFALLLVVVDIVRMPSDLRGIYNHAEKTIQTLLHAESEAVDMGKKPFSFYTLVQCQLNEKQREVFADFQEDMEYLYNLYLDAGHVINANGHNWEDVNIYHKVLGMSGKAPTLYEHLGYDKQGVTGNSGNRRVPYDKQWKEEGNDGPAPIISSLKYHDLPIKFKHKVVKETEDRLKKYTYPPGERPKTYGEALKRDSEGLPMHTQDWIHSVVYSNEESLYGGAKAVNGNLIHMLMATTESGSHVSRENRGYTINRDAARNEWVNMNTTGAVARDKQLVKDNFDEFLAFMSMEHPRMLELLLSGVHEPEELLLAWKVGQLPSCPPRFEHAKPLIASKVSPGTPIVNAFVGEPIERPKTFAQCHDINAYRKNNGERQRIAVGVALINFSKNKYA